MSRDPKGRLLFIAPHLPRYDKYSGDLRMFRLLEILSENHQVVFLAQDETGEGPNEEERYRAALEQLGVATHVRDYSLPGILLAERYQAAIIEFYYLADHYIPRIRILQPKCRVIVDSVDLHYRRAYSKYLVTKKPADLKMAEMTKEKELAVYGRADMVVAVTQEDAELLRADCPGLTIRMIPNIHDPSPKEPENRSHNLLFVGGFQHEPNADAVLFFCEKIFPRVRAAIPDCTLTVVGSNPPEEIRRLHGDSIQIRGFVPDLDPVFRNSDISVAPLRFGAGMKGKVGEAMSQGLPVVTTSVGAQGMGLDHRRNAMISDAPEEFADSVLELFRNRDLYETIRRNACEHIANMCGTEAVGKLVNDMIRETAGINPMQMSLVEKVGYVARFVRRYLS